MGSIKGIKFELALIDDLNKATEEALKQEANYYSDFKLELNKVINTADKIEAKYNSLSAVINDVTYKMDKQAKELGLDIKDTPSYKKAMTAIRAVDGRKDAINQIIANIQKFGF